MQWGVVSPIVEQCALGEGRQTDPEGPAQDMLLTKRSGANSPTCSATKNNV